jgi:hypothetical protein
MEDGVASEIKSGISGFALLVPAVFMAIILTVIGIASPGSAAQLWYGIFGEVIALIFAIGVLLVSMGAVIIGKYYQNVLPYAAGIIGIVGATLGLVGAIMGVVVLFSPALAVVTNVMVPAASVLDGIFFILFGVALIILRNKVGLVGFSISTGIMAIVVGALMCPEILSVYLTLASMVVLIPTAICGAYLLSRAKGIPEMRPKEEKKLAVRVVEVKPKKRMRPEEVEAEVYKYVKRSPGGIDIAECAEELGISEEEVQKAINALVRKGKLEIG